MHAPPPVQASASSDQAPPGTAGTAFNATRALTATCATSGSMSAVRATSPSAASALPSRPEADDRLEPHPRVGIGQALDERSRRNTRRILLAIGQGLERELAHARVGGQLHQRRDRFTSQQLLEREDRRDPRRQRPVRTRERLQTRPDRRLVAPAQDLALGGKAEDLTRRREVSNELLRRPPPSGRGTGEHPRSLGPVTRIT